MRSSMMLLSTVVLVMIMSLLNNLGADAAMNSRPGTKDQKEKEKEEAEKEKENIRESLRVFFETQAAVVPVVPAVLIGLPELPVLGILYGALANETFPRLNFSIGIANNQLYAFHLAIATQWIKDHPTVTCYFIYHGINDVVALIRQMPRSLIPKMPNVFMTYSSNLPGLTSWLLPLNSFSDEIYNQTGKTLLDYLTPAATYDLVDAAGTIWAVIWKAVVGSVFINTDQFAATNTSAPPPLASNKTWANPYWLWSEMIPTLEHAASNLPPDTNVFTASDCNMFSIITAWAQSLNVPLIEPDFKTCGWRRPILAQTFANKLLPFMRTRPTMVNQWIYAASPIMTEYLATPIANWTADRPTPNSRGTCPPITNVGVASVVSTPTSVIQRVYSPDNKTSLTTWGFAINGKTSTPDEIELAKSWLWFSIDFTNPALRNIYTSVNLAPAIAGTELMPDFIAMYAKPANTALRISNVELQKAIPIFYPSKIDASMGDVLTQGIDLRILADMMYHPHPDGDLATVVRAFDRGSTLIEYFILPACIASDFIVKVGPCPNGTSSNFFLLYQPTLDYTKVNVTCRITDETYDALLALASIYYSAADKLFLTRPNPEFGPQSPADVLYVCATLNTNPVSGQPLSLETNTGYFVIDCVALFWSVGSGLKTIDQARTKTVGQTRVRIAWIIGTSILYGVMIWGFVLVYLSSLNYPQLDNIVDGTESIVEVKFVINYGYVVISFIISQLLLAAAMIIGTMSLGLQLQDMMQNMSSNSDDDDDSFSSISRSTKSSSSSSSSSSSTTSLVTLATNTTEIVLPTTVNARITPNAIPLKSFDDNKRMNDDDDDRDDGDKDNKDNKDNTTNPLTTTNVLTQRKSSIMLPTMNKLVKSSSSAENDKGEMILTSTVNKNVSKNKKRRRYKYNNIRDLFNLYNQVLMWLTLSGLLISLSISLTYYVLFYGYNVSYASVNISNYGYHIGAFLIGWFGYVVFMHFCMFSNGSFKRSTITPAIMVGTTVLFVKLLEWGTKANYYNIYDNNGDNGNNSSGIVGNVATSIWVIVGLVCMATAYFIIEHINAQHMISSRSDVNLFARIERRSRKKAEYHSFMVEQQFSLNSVTKSGHDNNPWRMLCALTPFLIEYQMHSKQQHSKNNKKNKKNNNKTTAVTTTSTMMKPDAQILSSPSSITATVAVNVANVPKTMSVKDAISTEAMQKTIDAIIDRLTTYTPTSDGIITISTKSSLPSIFDKVLETKETLDMINSLLPISAPEIKIVEMLEDQYCTDILLDAAKKGRKSEEMQFLLDLRTYKKYFEDSATAISTALPGSQTQTRTNKRNYIIQLPESKITPEQTLAMKLNSISDISEKYLRVGGQFQLNISAELRASCLVTCNLVLSSNGTDPVPSKTLFDPLFKPAADLLWTNIGLTIYREQPVTYRICIIIMALRQKINEFVHDKLRMDDHMESGSGGSRANGANGANGANLGKSRELPDTSGDKRIAYMSDDDAGSDEENHHDIVKVDGIATNSGDHIIGSGLVDSRKQHVIHIRTSTMETTTNTTRTSSIPNTPHVGEIPYTSQTPHTPHHNGNTVAAPSSPQLSPNHLRRKTVSPFHQLQGSIITSSLISGSPLPGQIQPSSTT
jgi:hypothetical protein